MPRYRYRALRQSGGEFQGELVAEDERAAARELQDAGGLPIEIALADAAVSRRRTTAPRLSPRELVLFTRQLASLLSAGVVLDRALSLIADDRSRARRGAMARQLLDAVRRGESLSQAMGAVPSFAGPYAMMVAAGEARGDSGGALDRLAGVLERNRAIAQSLANALVYPASVLVVAVLSIGFLLGFVVPRFSVLLTSLQHEPPAAMEFLLALSAIVQWVALPLLVVALGATAYIVARRRDEAFRLSLARRIVALPAVGGLIANIESERLTFLLGTLAASGVALSAAFAASREASGNAALRAGLGEAARRIERGERVSASLAAVGFVPELALELVRVGEETGELAPMLLKASDLLRKEIEATTSTWIGLAAPISMLLLGLLVGAIALALFGTILEVYDFAT